MTAGMAEVIAAHDGYTVKMPNDVNAPFTISCNGCGDARPIINELGNVRTPPQRQATHVAEELAKAGYGSIPDALRDAANEWIAGDWAAAFIAVEDDAIVSQASANWLRQRARLLEKASFNRRAATMEAPHGVD